MLVTEPAYFCFIKNIFNVDVTSACACVSFTALLVFSMGFLLIKNKLAFGAQYTISEFDTSQLPVSCGIILKGLKAIFLVSDFAVANDLALILFQSMDICQAIDQKLISFVPEKRKK